MKACFKCGAVLSLAFFYRHAGMADGHLNKCIGCTKRDVAENRRKNIFRVRAYDRDRSTLPHRIDLRRRTVRAWMQRYPARTAAHAAVRRAVTCGDLTKPAYCQRCGQGGRIEAHHHDYDQPLAVTWLCKPCHAQADAQRRGEISGNHSGY